MLILQEKTIKHNQKQARALIGSIVYRLLGDIVVLKKIQ